MGFGEGGEDGLHGCLRCWGVGALLVGGGRRQVMVTPKPGFGQPWYLRSAGAVWEAPERGVARVRVGATRAFLPLPAWSRKMLLQQRTLMQICDPTPDLERSA